MPLCTGRPESVQQITFMKSMAREENYEMPVRINGEVTAINLKMIHGDGKEARVAITLETELLGKCAAEFTYTKGVHNLKTGGQPCQRIRQFFVVLV